MRRRICPRAYKQLWASWDGNGVSYLIIELTIFQADNCWSSTSENGYERGRKGFGKNSQDLLRYYFGLTSGQSFLL